MAAKVSIEFAY
jgi:hypothetical protein